jgi:hypothetical protein
MLLERMDRERLHGDELVLRLLTRSHLETWLTSAWVHLGGNDTCSRLIGAYRKSLEVQARAYAEHNARVDREQRKARRYNRTVDRDNERVAKRNARTGETLPLRDPVPYPEEIQKIDLDLGPVIERFQDYEPAD